jgi:hypothetical protein
MASIDLSKPSFKALLLHYGNNIPVVQADHVKGCPENMQVINKENYMW